jgi:hypothetical protein
VVGTLLSRANTTYRVEFFASPTADPSGHGQAQVYLRYATVTTDASGNASFATLVPFAAPAGWAVSATATAVTGTNPVSVLASGDTSEFSADFTVSSRRGRAGFVCRRGRVGCELAEGVAAAVGPRAVDRVL